MRWAYIFAILLIGSCSKINTVATYAEAYLCESSIKIGFYLTDDLMSNKAVKKTNNSNNYIVSCDSDGIFMLENRYTVMITTVLFSVDSNNRIDSIIGYWNKYYGDKSLMMSYEKRSQENNIYSIGYWLNETLGKPKFKTPLTWENKRFKIQLVDGETYGSATLQYISISTLP